MQPSPRAPANGPQVSEDELVRATFVCECGRPREICVSLVPTEGRTVFARPLLSAARQNPLSPFEAEVLQHVAAGLTDIEVARELNVTVSSFRYALRTAMARLSARNRAEAVFRAVSAGYLAPAT
jgi:DNA-binding NarL/FixJ family response regulator